MTFKGNGKVLSKINKHEERESFGKKKKIMEKLRKNSSFSLTQMKIIVALVEKNELFITREN